MRRKIGPSSSPNELRRRAEAKVGGHDAPAALLSLDESQRLIHELEVHQVELDMQNDELRQSRHNLEESRNRYAELYDFAPVGYVTLDSHGKVLEMNLTLSTLLLEARVQLERRNFGDFVDAIQKADFQEHLANCMYADEVVTTELTLVDVHERKVPVQLQSVRTESSQWGLVYQTAVVDLTARKGAEEQLRRLNLTLETRVLERTAEAEARTAQLRILAEELTQAEERERRRLAQVLHDHLQQLLVAARIKLSIYRRKHPKSQNGDLRQVDELIDQAITESRALTVELSPPVLYDSGLVGGLEWLARHMREKNNLRVALDIDPAAEPREESTRVFLFQIAREMLLNVVKHAHTDTARVRLTRAGEDRLQLVVADDGVGFEPEKPDAVRQQEGFGLFHIRERLKLLGGRLEIRSMPGLGTEALVDIPLRIESQAREVLPVMTLEKPRRRRTAKKSRAASRGKIQVLLADDHAILRQSLAGNLRDYASIAVVGEASNGREAVELAHQLQPDVVVMDITMPLLNGVEATREIVRSHPQIRVIGLSMHEQADMAKAMLQAGAVAYLRKDADTDTLVAAIAEHAKRGESGGGGDEERG